MEAAAPGGEMLTGHCKYYGGTDDSKFGESMPWIGKYIALASLVPLPLIGLDVFHSYRFRKLWVEAKWYALNAATLTILGVAIKIPSDITGSMPGLCEQLAKLSGVALVCITMGHSVSFLGKMDDGTILSNLIALGILVITLFVNIWIQIQTGVVTDFAGWYKACSILMLYLFYLTVFHTLSLRKAMRPLKNLYATKHNLILNETGHSYCHSGLPISKLRDYIDKYWLMALSSSSENPLLSTVPLVATSTCGILGMTFLVMAFKSDILKSIREGCCAKSDYKRSVVFVLFIQLSTIAVGTMVCLSRLASIGLGYFGDSVNISQADYYFSHIINDLTYHNPLPRFLRQTLVDALFFFFTKVITLLVLQILQSPIEVLVLFQFFIVAMLLGLVHEIMSCSKNRGQESSQAQNEELSEYVLVGNRRPKYKETLMKRLHIPGTWIKQGQSRKFSRLFNFIRENSIPSQGFMGMVQVINRSGDQVTAELRNSWSLTLASLGIIVRVTTPRETKLSSLMEVVASGLECATFVDENLCSHRSKELMKTAKASWDEFYQRGYIDCFGMNLMDLWALGDYKRIIHQLKIQAKLLVDKHIKENEAESPWDWPKVVILAGCLYNISSSIITNIDLPNSIPIDQSVTPHLQLHRALSDIIAAWLLNLATAIVRHCSSGTFGDREEKVREAAIMLGEVEEILQWLQEQTCLEHCPNTNMEFLDNWNAHEV